jgi:hypothetical protein
MDTMRFFPGDKAAGARSLLLISTFFFFFFGV